MHDQITDLAARGIEAMLACGDTTDEEYGQVSTDHTTWVAIAHTQSCHSSEPNISAVS
jgi:hypothetical protein